MQVFIAVPEEPYLLEALFDWLRQEEDLRGRTTRTATPLSPGEMGSLADTLTVAVGGGGALTVLFTSIAVWLRTRRSDIAVEVTVGDHKVRVEGKRVKADTESLRELVAEANRAIERN